MTELDLQSRRCSVRVVFRRKGAAQRVIAPLQRLTPLTNKAIKHQLYTYPQGERSNLMSQSLWLFGSRLTIVADRTTTAGQYDLIEEYSLPGSQTPLHLHTR